MLAMVTIVMFSFFCVIGDGPGFLPLKWKEGNTSKYRVSPHKSLSDQIKIKKFLKIYQDTQYFIPILGQMIFCDRCKGFQAPRSQHCDHCGRCVLKMSHHCTVFNVCIGHYNQKHFITFLTSCLIASLQSAATICMGLRR